MLHAFTSNNRKIHTEELTNETGNINQLCQQQKKVNQSYLFKVIKMTLDINI